VLFLLLLPVTLDTGFERGMLLILVSSWSGSRLEEKKMKVSLSLRGMWVGMVVVGGLFLSNLMKPNGDGECV
jgi:hypothetical protein